MDKARLSNQQHPNDYSVEISQINYSQQDSSRYDILDSFRSNYNPNASINTQLGKAANSLNFSTISNFPTHHGRSIYHEQQFMPKHEKCMRKLRIDVNLEQIESF